MDTKQTRNKSVPRNAEGVYAIPQITPRAAQLIQTDLSKFAEGNRLRQMFVKTTDSAVAVVALPTTTASHAFINLNQSKSVVVEALAFYGGTTGGAASMITMVAMLDNTKVTSQTATADTATGVASLSGGNYGGLLVSSHAVTVVNKGWFPLTPHGHSGALTDTEGCSLYANLEGMIIIPPGNTLAVDIIAINATLAGTISMFFSEVDLDLV
jgi:hypothetical protein